MKALCKENVWGNSRGYSLAFKSTEAKIPFLTAQLEGFNSLYIQR